VEKSAQDQLDGAQMSGLINYYEEYASTRFRKKSGEPYEKRSLQIFAKKFDLPLIRIGNCALIDPDAGDDRLRECAHRPGEKEPRGRGRPPRSGR
jgi:hypothetical protein